MSPNLRRELHRALDIVLDAMAAEADESAPKAKRRRGPALPELPAPGKLPPHLQAQLDRQLGKNGYQKTG